MKPFMKKMTAVERSEILDKAVEALNRGDDDEYYRLGLMLPASPGIADDLKRSLGIKAIIESGMNLIEAVEVYGEDWLEN